MNAPRVVMGVAVLAALALAVSGSIVIVGDATATPQATPHAASAQNPRSGTYAGRVAIGAGRALYLRCAGEGSPTVLLESGIHDSSDTWTSSDTTAAPVFEEVSRYTHVCAYDRPGTVRYTNPPALTTRSTPVTMPRTLTGMASDLHALVTAAGIPGPYVLVGHSYGGMIVRLFAQTYPASTAGIVFVDAFGPNIKALFGSQWSAYAQTLNKPGTALDDQPDWETIDPNEAIDAIAKGGPLPTVPAAVISKTEPFAVSPSVPAALTQTLEKAWPHVQNALVSLEPNTPHAFATGSDHYVQVRDPDLTDSMIRLVFDRATAAAAH